MGPTGEAIAGLSVSGLAARMTPDKVARCAEIVMTTAQEMSGRMEL